MWVAYLQMLHALHCIAFFVIMLCVGIFNVFDHEVTLLLTITYLIATCVDTHECLEVPPHVTMMCGIKSWKKIVNKCRTSNARTLHPKNLAFHKVIH